MRKPRDYDAELKLLDERAARLKAAKLKQLGELVIATRADALPVEILAGALLAAAAETDKAVREEWRRAGVGFFQRTRRAQGEAAADNAAAAPDAGGTLPLGPDPRAS
jgi:hypothetical protein